VTDYLPSPIDNLPGGVYSMYMTNTEINHQIRSIEIAAIGMGHPLNAGQRNAIARLQAQLTEEDGE
jgi:hypothetical protein